MLKPITRREVEVASIGFRVKTGRAIAIALGAEQPAPAFLARWNVSLYDSTLPAHGPYHEVLELPWVDAQSAVRPFERRIEEVAIAALSALLRELTSERLSVCSIGIVGSPDRSLERLGSPHIRAHAAEGILFRRVLEVAAAKHKLQWRSFSDRDFDEVASSELRLNPEKIQSTLAAIGKAAGKPWRIDERAAASAAWLMLLSRRL